MLFEENRLTGRQIAWPVKPNDQPAVKPQDATILKLLAEYKADSFRVNDGWAVVIGQASTVISFATPIEKWESILKTLVTL